MSRNGSGSYSLPSGNPVVPSTVISSTWANNTLSDIATALTQSIANDGQTVPVANLPMAGFRHTNVANAQNRNEYAAAGQIQDSSLQWLTSVAGTDTITANISPSPITYSAGQTFRFVASGSNTTNAVTLNINGIGAKNITKFGAQVLSKGDIQSGAVLELVYDGTQFQIASITPPRAGYAVRGLVGVNNAGALTSKYDLSADQVVLLNPVTGETITRLNTGTITCDTGLAGAAANGRDQAGAFSANTWLYLYFIWNGATLATIVSAVTPPTGPTLPTGYTHWAFATALRFDGSSLLLRTRTRGNAVSYLGEFPTLSGAGNTTETVNTWSNVVPPNAMEVKVNIGAQLATNGGGGAGSNFELRTDSGVSDTFRLSVIVPAANQNNGVNSCVVLPNVGQQIYFLFTAETGSANIGTRQGFISMMGYTIPNGD